MGINSDAIGGRHSLGEKRRVKAALHPPSKGIDKTPSIIQEKNYNSQEKASKSTTLVSNRYSDFGSFQRIPGEESKTGGWQKEDDGVVLNPLRRSNTKTKRMERESPNISSSSSSGGYNRVSSAFGDSIDDAELVDNNSSILSVSETNTLLSSETSSVFSLLHQCDETREGDRDIPPCPPPDTSTSCTLISSPSSTPPFTIVTHKGDS